MIVAVRYSRIPTIGTIPFAAAEIVRRNRDRERKQRQRRIRTAKLGPSETVDSNLPTR